MKVADMKKFHKFNKKFGGTFTPGSDAGKWFVVREDRMNKIIDLIDAAETFLYHWQDTTEPVDICKASTALENALVELEKE